VFISFLVLPAPSVQMDGLCCSFGILTAMVVTLTNTPAVWLAFPNFCSDFDSRCCKRKSDNGDEQEAARRLGLDVSCVTCVCVCPETGKKMPNFAFEFQAKFSYVSTPLQYDITFKFLI
jgi:predicted RND superfamily exporter protein